MTRLIDADALHKLFGAVTTDLLSKPELSKDFEHMVRAFIMTTEMIEDAPTVDAVPVRHGKWIETEFIKLRECSCCHVRWGMYDTENFIYCPECGARMDKDD